MLDASAIKAVAEVRPRLAELPTRCGTPVPHATIALGQSLEGIIRREQGQLDIANKDKRDCAGFYQEQKLQLEGTN